MRLIAVSGALLGWFALLLQFSLLPVLALRLFIGFFTIWSNIAATALLARSALRPGPQDRRVVLAVAVAIGMVGIIYSAFVVFFLLGPNQDLRWRDAGHALILPLAYCVYALARGSIDGWYAYPLLDAGKLGAGVLARNIAGLATAFLLMALLVVAVAKPASRLRTLR